MLLTLAGCTDKTDYYESTTVEESYTSETTSEVTERFNGTGIFGSTDVSTTEPTTRNPIYSDPVLSTPTFNNLLSLRDYLNMQKKADVLDFSFKYTGTDKFTAQMIAQMTNAYYISYTNSGNLYDIEITEYPGDHIVDAWKTNNTTSLTFDEKLTLDMAISIVNKARARATNAYELEIILHDMISERVTYYDGTTDVQHENDIKRHLTVIGALLDGKANCQGYTDAFYTLASIAGFKVDRMSVGIEQEDLHMANTICFNNKWYIVDVTYDDSDSDEIANYRLFNAGKDVIQEYNWPDYKEINPLTPFSDNLFYYNRYNIVYTDMQSMANAMVNNWANNGTKTIRGMLKYNNNTQSFGQALKNAAESTGKAYSYTYWTYYTDRDSYYTVKFNY